MYLAITPKKSCAAAWVEAFATVNAQKRHKAHNVIIDVAEPLSQSAAVRVHMLSECSGSRFTFSPHALIPAAMMARQALAAGGAVHYIAS